MTDNHDDVRSDLVGSCFICGGMHGDHDHEAASRPSGISRRGVMTGMAAAGGAAAVAGLATPAQAQGRRFGNRRLPRGPFVIEAGWVLAWRNNEMTLLRDASVLVRGDRVEEVREGPIRGSFDRIELPDQLVMPGMISGHTHCCSATPTRGIIEGGRSFARPLIHVEALTDSELDALTAFNMAELLRGGSTTHVEMSLSLRQAESYVRVAKKWGVRGYPSGMVPGILRLFPIWFRQDDQVLHDSVPDTLKEIQANLEFGRRNNRAEEGRILPQLGPHATDTQTPETMLAYLAGAKELGNGIHIHLAQSTRETATVKKLWGASPVEWMRQLGLLDVPVFGAHMNGVDWKDDAAILKSHGVVYAHCPSGGGAGGGTQPFPEALGAGVATNVGIDTHSNDMIENIKLAVIYGQARESLTKDTSAFPMKKPTIWDAVSGVTHVAADGLRRPDLGRIAPGAKADLISVDVSGLLVGTGALPPEPLNNLLYAHGLSVRNVMTDGNFQIMDGELVVDDQENVARRGGQAVQKIWGLLEDEDWFKPTAR